jgi:hypothetical protein
VYTSSTSGTSSHQSHLSQTEQDYLFISTNIISRTEHSRMLSQPAVGQQAPHGSEKAMKLQISLQKK